MIQKKEKFLRFQASIENWNIDITKREQQLNLQNHGECVWVPAAFNSLNTRGRKVYGGVSMLSDWKEIAVQTVAQVALTVMTGGSSLPFQGFAALARSAGIRFARNSFGKILRMVTKNSRQGNSNFGFKYSSGQGSSSSSSSFNSPNRGGFGSGSGGGSGNGKKPKIQKKVEQSKGKVKISAVIEDGDKTRVLWSRYRSTDPKTNTQEYFVRFNQKGQQVYHYTRHKRKDGDKRQVRYQTFNKRQKIQLSEDKIIQGRIDRKQNKKKDRLQKSILEYQE